MFNLKTHLISKLQACIILFVTTAKYNSLGCSFPGCYTDSQEITLSTELLTQTLATVA